jgi:hypothetical protein
MSVLLEAAGPARCDLQMLKGGDWLKKYPCDGKFNNQIDGDAAELLSTMPVRNLIYSDGCVEEWLKHEWDIYRNKQHLSKLL